MVLTKIKMKIKMKMKFRLKKETKIMKDTIERRILSAVVTVVIMVTAIIPTAMIGGLASSVLVGDVNGDGEIDEIDASLILQHTAELITLSEEQLGRGDVNADGETDPIDAAFVLMHSSGIKAIEQPSDHVHTKGKCIDIRMSMSCDEQGYYTWICGICGERWYEGNGVYHQWKPDRHLIYDNEVGWDHDDSNFIATRQCYRCGLVESAPYVFFTNEELEYIRDKFQSLLNEERAKNGLSQLKTGDTEKEMAQVRANELIVNFSHDRPNGKRPVSVFEDFGWETSRYGGEAIALVHRESVEDIAVWAFTFLMDSPSHREVLMSESCTGIGVGCFGYLREHWPNPKNISAYFSIIMFR